MKKNVLVIGGPIYALLDFYKKKLERSFLKYNFYIVTDNIGISQEYFNELFLLKKKGVIIDFYIIPRVSDKTFFKNFSRIEAFFIAKNYLTFLEKVNFTKIICSDFINPEIRFIVNNLYKTYHSSIISISIHNFKLNEEIENSFLSLNYFTINIKKFFQLITNIHMFHLFIKDFFLNIISIFILQEKLIFLSNNRYFPLFHKKQYAIVSSKEMEIDAYLTRFNNLKIFYLAEDTNCKCSNNIKYNKKLLILLDMTEHKEKYTDFMINSFLKNILLLNAKYDFSSIDIKNHPRDFSLNSEILRTKILQMRIKVKILNKNLFLNEDYCQYSCVLGTVSSIMISSVNQCKNILVLGILEIANKLFINPKPKNLTGDFKSFRSGIVWIEDTLNFSNLLFDDLLLLSKEIKNKKFIRNFQFKNFEELLEL